MEEYHARIVERRPSEQDGARPYVTRLYYARDTHLHHHRRFRSDRQHAPARGKPPPPKKAKLAAQKAWQTRRASPNYVALDPLRHLHGPGESYSDVILRLGGGGVRPLVHGVT
jgi:hypothetical protein